MIEIEVKLMLAVAGLQMDTNQANTKSKVSM